MQAHHLATSRPHHPTTYFVLAIGLAGRIIKPAWQKTFLADVLVPKLRLGTLGGEALLRINTQLESGKFQMLTAAKQSPAKARSQAGAWERGRRWADQSFSWFCSSSNKET